MLVNLLSSVGAIEPGVWETIKENLVLVFTTITGAIASVKLLLGSVKSGFTSAGDTAAKATNEQTTVQSMFAEKRELAEDKFRLETKRARLEKDNIDFRIKLEATENPENRELIQQKIQENEAEIAVVKKEIESVNTEIGKYTSVITATLKKLSGSK